MRYISVLCLAILLFSCSKDPDNSNTSSSTLTDGLVAYYPFSGNAADATANHNDGTVTGAQLTTDRFNSSNSAYSFNGTNDFISIGTSQSLDIKEDFSVSAWIKPVDYALPGVVLWHGDAVYAKDPFILYFSGRPGYNALGIRKDADDGLAINEVFAQQNVIFSNVWMHVVATCNVSAKQLKLYINGELIASKSFSSLGITYPTTNFFTMIGADTGTSGVENFFKGKIDEVRIYNRELTPSEVEELTKK